MERVQKERYQVDDRLVFENLVRMSRENNHPVTIRVEGREYTGIIKDLMYTSPAYGGMLYVRFPDPEDDTQEQHVLISIEDIIDLQFATEVGMLDDLIA